MSDIITLIQSSPSVASMKKATREALLKLAQAGDSAVVKKLLRILEEEKARLEHVETTFKKIVTKAVNRFEAGVLDIQKQSDRKHFQKVRAQAERESSVQAEHVLRDLEA